MYKSDNNLNNRLIFSNNLMRLMQRNHTKQSELAKAINVSNSTVNDWIKCRTYPRIDKIDSIAQYFGVTKSTLITENFYSMEMLTDNEKQLLEIYQNCSDEHKELIFKMLEAAIKD